MPTYKRFMIFFQYVDVIHTDAGILGHDASLGTLDFWPNSGSNQPGCMVLDEACDHARSWKYFSESVNSLDLKFNALACSNYKTFMNGSCAQKTSSNNMGIDANFMYE